MFEHVAEYLSSALAFVGLLQPVGTEPTNPQGPVILPDGRNVTNLRALAVELRKVAQGTSKTVDRFDMAVWLTEYDSGVVTGCCAGVAVRLLDPEFAAGYLHRGRLQLGSISQRAGELLGIDEEARSMLFGGISGFAHRPEHIAEVVDWLAESGTQPDILHSFAFIAINARRWKREAADV